MSAGKQVRSPLVELVASAAVAFSALYFVSDVIELVQGGFSTPQLVLTYVAEAAIPLFVLGLYAAQRPHIGALGLWGAIGYAYAYVFFTGTVLLALVDRSANWDTLVTELGPWVTIHGALMMVAGSAFGVAVTKAKVLPRWTGITLVAGVVLVALSSLLQGMLPAVAETLCAGVRDLGFAGMGLALMRGPNVRHPTSTEQLTSDQPERTVFSTD